MIVLPAIDLLAGQAVRLHQGDYAQVKVYDPDPAARARTFRGKAALLHVVDLEGAKAGRPVQREAVRAIVAAFGPGVQIGGGVRSREAFCDYLDLGAARVVIGSKALADPELIRALAAEHPGRVVLAVDAKGGLVAIEGWTQTSTTTAVELVRAFAGAPLGAVLYTDVARDGTMAGPNVEMTALLARESHVPVIASGGVGTLGHLRALAEHRGIGGAIVGRALYEGAFTLDEAIAAAA